MKVECEFCKKMYANAYVLKTHQKTVKSCIQGQKKVYECEYCIKKLTKKESLEKHYAICKKKKENDTKKIETDQLEKENKKIEEMDHALKLKDDKIKELEEKLTHSNITNIGTQNNNNITIYQVMTPEHVLDVFQKNYNLDTLLGGQKALAKFVNDGFLTETPSYVCGDRSRQKFYMIQNGKKVEDTNCEGLIELTAPGFPHVQDIYEEAMFNDTDKELEIHDTYQKLINMSADHHEFNAELSKIVTEEPDKKGWKKMLKSMKERNEKLFSDVGKPPLPL